MFIAPVSNKIYNSHIKFGSNYANKEKSCKDSNSGYYSSGSLRRFPLMVLIAMSPLTSAESSAKYSIPQTSSELCLYSNDEDLCKDEISRETVSTGYQKCSFIKYDNDYNKENSEELGFRYSYLSEGGYQGILGGVLTSICSQQNSNRSYYATFYEYDSGKKSNRPQLVKIPEKFGKYVLNFAKSKENNNAIYALPKSSYERVFGADSIKNAPMIENVVTKTVSSEGVSFPNTKPDGYWEQ